MDRGVPTEEVLEEMRNSDALVGTPKARLKKLEADLLDQELQQVQAGVTVKLLPRGEELYVLAKSQDRVCKERAMRRRQLQVLWNHLKDLQRMKLSRDQLLLKLGAAQNQPPAAWRLVDVANENSDSKLRFLRSGSGPIEYERFAAVKVDIF